MVDIFDSYNADLVDPFEEERERRRLQAIAMADQEPVEVAEEESSFLRNLFGGLGRGVAELATLGFAEFEDSNSTVSDLAETAVQFFVPFLGAAAWIGRGAKVGRLALAPKALTGAGRASEAARFATAGAISDLAFMDGNEGRLADLINAHPDLANPITDFLASNPDDGEAFGRLKNAIEGGVTGATLDLILLGARAMKAGRAAQAAGKSEPKVVEAIDEAVPQAEMRDAAQRAVDEIHNSQDVASGRAFTRPTSEEEAAVARGELFLTPQTEVPTTLGPGSKPREFPLRNPRQLANELKVQAPIDSSVNPRRLSHEERMDALLERTDLNLARMPETPAEMVRVVERVFDDVIDDAAVSNAATIRKAQVDAADLYGMDHEPFINMVDKTLKDQKDVLKRTVALKFLLREYSNEFGRMLSEVIKASADGPVPGIMKRDLRVMLERYGTTVRAVKGLMRGHGRALQTGNIDYLPVGRVQRAIFEAEGQGIDEGDFLDAVRKMRDAFADGGHNGASKLRATVEGTWRQKAWRVANDVFLNNILSNPATQVVSLGSGLAMAVYRPLERMMGALVGGIGGHTLPEARVAVNELRGLAKNFSDSMSAAGQSLKEGRPILSASAKIETDHAGQTAIRSNSETWGGTIINWFGRLITAPGRGLTAGDELSKQLHYRSVVEARLIEAAQAAGKSGEEAERWVLKRMELATYENRAFSEQSLFRMGQDRARKRGLTNQLDIDEYAGRYATRMWNTGDSAFLKEIAAEARRAGEEGTFTNPLNRRGGMAERTAAWMQRAAGDVPPIRLFAPFVRTPFNIAKAVWDRTGDVVIGGGQMLASKVWPAEFRFLRESKSRFVQDFMSGDVGRRSEALGRMATGLGFVSWANSMVSSGSITGRGPEDPVQRQLLQSAGWQPYSIKVGDSYVSYLRVDPFASLLGIVADMSDASRLLAEEDTPELESYLFATITAITNNLTNKTYTLGLKNLFDVMSNPIEKAPRHFSRLAGAALVPLSGLTGAIAATGDPVMRDVATLGDGIMSKLPYYSTRVPAIRNFMGDPVHRMRAAGTDSIGSVMQMFVPVAHSTVSDDLVYQEVARLGHSFRPPRAITSGVDLRGHELPSGQSAYDRLLELRGEVEVGGVGLKKALRRLIRSEGYQRLSPDSTAELPSPRVSRIKGVVLRYHQAAMRKLRRELPAVENEIRSNRLQARLSRMSRFING